MKKVADAFFPTEFGEFRIYAFVDEHQREHLVLVRCDHNEHNDVPIRVHSRCLTGDALSSKRCDCRSQLEASMRYIEKNKCGMIIYLDQEGRGIGLANKIKAYALQDNGMDTVEANVHLGFGEDIRDYKPAADIIKYFGIMSVALLTNNPKKIDDLKKHGVNVVRRIPLVIRKNKFNRRYLETKKDKMGHLI